MLDPAETWRLPAAVYVASRPDSESAGPMLELRTVGEWARSAVLGYSSLDEFLTGCGPNQPWMLLPSERLAEWVRDEDGESACAMLLDAPMPAELRGTAGGMAGAEAAWDEPDSADWASLYIPSRPFWRGKERAELELQPMPGERLALMAYTSQRSLEFGCGSQQPWVSVPAGLASEVRRQSGAHTICLDTPLPNYLRHGFEEEVDR